MNVAIFLHKSSARASSKKLRRNAFFMLVQDVRDTGGNYVNKCEASPASEYLRSMQRKIVLRDSIGFNGRNKILEPLQMVHRMLMWVTMERCLSHKCKVLRLQFEIILLKDRGRIADLLASYWSALL